MNISNRDRVGHALELLREGLYPAVDQAMRAHKGPGWAQEMDRQGHLDTATLLRTIDRYWGEVFSRKLDRVHRSLANELISVRNNWAHDRPFDLADTLRALDTAGRLLKGLSTGQHADEIGRSYDTVVHLLVEEQGRSKVPPPRARSNTERGKAFQLICREALQRKLRREFDVEVRMEIGGGKLHSFDLVTRERDVVAEAKAFAYTAGGNIPSAKITTLREAVMYLHAVDRAVQRLLIIKHDLPANRKETLAQYFVRLNTNHLLGITVLEIPEDGGELDCLHGSFVPKG